MLSELKNAFIKSSDERIFEYVMFLCLCLFVISLPTSRAFVSISQILLGINWLLEGSYTEKFRRLRKNRASLYLIGVFFVYALGLFWTQDLAYGLGSVMKNKLPYLSLIFVVASSRPIKDQRIVILPLLFAAALVVATLAGAVVVLSEAHTDPRDVSPFIPHIHLSMMILMTAFFLPWYVRRLSAGKKWLYLTFGISIWLIVFMFIMGTLTGIISLAVVLVFLVIRNLIVKPGILKTVSVSLILILFVVSFAFVINKITKPLCLEIDPAPQAYLELTEEGNPYSHDMDNRLRENGHLVFTFIAEDELREAWNQRSEIGFDSLDLAGNSLKHTLYRYLSSLGLRKDKAGMDALSDEDVKAVEQGLSNYLYTEWPNVYVRIHQTFWELYSYRETANPSGHSFTQRLEVWRAGFAVVKMKPLFGWGTGDHLDAIQFGLEHIESKFDSFRLRHAHNQFLHLTIMLGVSGLTLIFGLYFLFVWKSRAYRYLPFNILLVIVLVFMLGNSPLDSQMSLNFILFSALYFGVLIRE